MLASREGFGDESLLARAHAIEVPREVHASEECAAKGECDLLLAPLRLWVGPDRGLLGVIAAGAEAEIVA